MATLARTQIVDAFVTALTGLATTGARVFDSDVYPLETVDLPGLLVFWTTETTGPLTIGMDAENRLSVSVVAVAKTITGLRPTLDQICKEVQIALTTSPPQLGGRSHITRVGATAERGSLEKPTGQVTMNYEVVYYTAEDTPDVLV